MATTNNNTQSKHFHSMIPKRPSLAHYSSVSADITSDLFRNSSEEGQLDMKIGVLSK